MGDSALAGWRKPAGDRSCGDRKSTRLNSSHMSISYAVFCLKKKKKEREHLVGHMHAAHVDEGNHDDDEELANEQTTTVAADPEAPVNHVRKRGEQETAERAK